MQHWIQRWRIQPERQGRENNVLLWTLLTGPRRGINTRFDFGELTCFHYWGRIMLFSFLVFTFLLPLPFMTWILNQWDYHGHQHVHLTSTFPEALLILRSLMPLFVMLLGTAMDLASFDLRYKVLSVVVLCWRVLGYKDQTWHQVVAFTQFM